MINPESHELYSTWRHMKQRCLSPTNNDYPRYGGRGITVCDRWLNSFDDFVADMGERPLGHTLDRKDTNGNYTPDNCIWSTRRTQLHTRRMTYDASCIEQQSPNCYRVRIQLNKRTHRRSFRTLALAQEYVSDCRYEREFHYQLGL